MTFPRSRNGHIDTGAPVQASNRMTRCPNCESTKFHQSVSVEECKACGYRVDYWGGGANAVAREFEERRAEAERAEREEEERRWREETWE